MAAKVDAWHYRPTQEYRDAVAAALYRRDASASNARAASTWRGG